MDASHRGSLSQDGPIVVPKTADLLAQRLRDQILSGRLGPGSQLPTERELVEDASVSRASVREALRTLELEGLLEKRRGRNGGYTVRRPTGEEISRSVELFVRGARIDLVELLKVREAIEPMAAALAAANRTAEDLAELEAINAELAASHQNTRRFLDANLAWHMAVVHAGRNQLLEALMTALSGVIHRATEFKEFATPEIREATLRAHQRVTQAIEKCDVEAARRSMSRHVEATTAVAEKSGPEAPGKKRRNAKATAVRRPKAS